MFERALFFPRYHLITSNNSPSSAEWFFGDSAEEYTVKIASDVEEACKLLEVDFEFVTEFEVKKLFRKRK